MKHLERFYSTTSPQHLLSLVTQAHKQARVLADGGRLVVKDGCDDTD